MSDIRHGTLEGDAYIKHIPSPYNEQQVRLWLERMGIELDNNIFLSPSLEGLKTLVKHFLLTFPFDNTNMHYTAQNAMDISPEGVFNRVVNERRGGSYCFGLAGLMSGMLRRLGYRCYSVLGKVNERPSPSGLVTDYTSLNHQIILVQPEDDSNLTYLIDVGYGAGPVQPILLSNAEENIVPGIDSNEAHRITRTAWHKNSIETSKGSNIPARLKWNLEAGHKKPYSGSDDFQWQILYSFTEEEFYERDFHDASFIVDFMPAPFAFLRNNIVCVKYFVKEGSETKDITYRITLLGGHVKKQGEGSSQEIKTVHTELERIQVLHDTFGVHVDAENACHIAGRTAALNK